MLGRARRAARRAWQFLRYELPELAAPSSLPNPPHVLAAREAKRRPRLTPAQHATARACALLRASPQR